MNIFKKAVACLAAVTVMTSMAVTASADYQISGGIDDSGKYGMRVSGLPKEAFEYPNVGVQLFFGEDETLPAKHITAEIGPNMTHGYINDYDGNTFTYNKDVFFFYRDQDDGNRSYVFWFDEDSNEDIVKMMESPKCRVYVYAKLDGVSDGQPNWKFFDSKGNVAEVKYNELVTIDWTTSGSASETTSSEPVSSEPTPEPVSSEPAPEPISSEPVSETVSSEPTTSQPTNVDTGVTGIAAVVGAAVLAAGAVIVTRKKK